MNKKEIIKQGINLFNKHFPNDKHTTETEKTSLVKFFIELHELKESKKIKVLQSKVKTYEQDIINKPLNDMPTNINGRPFKGRL
jgi:hypothetical protein